MQKRSGFSLALVLVIMVFIIGISAVIMDMTTNYVSSSQSTIDHQKLYNAAQSGIEWGKGWLLDNKGELNVGTVSDVTNLDQLKAKKTDGTSYITYISPDDIDVDVEIYACNYTSDAYIDGAPPILESVGVSESGSSTRYGYSNYLDPNRNNTGINNDIGYAFVITSAAEYEDKDFKLETMVVIVP